MARNASISPGVHFDGFISQQLQTGRYGSASKVVRGGLRLLENSESKLDVLRRMLIEAEQSGVSDYNYDKFVA